MTPENTPVIRLSIQAGIGEARAVTFETYLGASSNAALISAVLDKLNYCIDRSKAQYDIVALEMQYDQETMLLDALKDNFVMLEENIANRRANNGKKGANPLTDNELKTRSQCEIQIKDRTKRLADLKVRIEEQKALIAKGSVPNGDNDSAATV